MRPASTRLDSGKVALRREQRTPTAARPLLDDVDVARLIGHQADLHLIAAVEGRFRQHFRKLHHSLQP